MKKHVVLAITVLSGLVSSAVLAAEPPAPWVDTCASCHGADGAGHTRKGHMTRVKDFTDVAVQKSFTDDQAFNAVKNGLVIRGTTKMKPFNHDLTDDEIKALVAYIRSLAK